MPIRCCSPTLLVYATGNTETWELNLLSGASHPLRQKEGKEQKETQQLIVSPSWKSADSNMENIIRSVMWLD